jgi:hypothetical protein
LLGADDIQGQDSHLHFFFFYRFGHSFAEETFLEVLKKTEEKTYRKLCLVLLGATLVVILNPASISFLFLSVFLLFFKLEVFCCFF